MPTDDLADIKTALTALRKPFPREQIGRLPKGGVFLDYVGHADVTARLLDVDPFWTWEPFATDPNGLPLFDATGGLWIRLTVCGVERIGYGDAGGNKGNGNAVKEAIGDALRNAAMRYGVALDLWAKGDRDFGVGHDTNDTPPPLPDHVQKVYEAIAPLSAEDKTALREWCEAEAITVSRDMDDVEAERVIARAATLAAR